MASMVRGGGETFDLEIARHLAELGCDVTFLTGIPLFGRAILGPADWWGKAGSSSSVASAGPHARREGVEFVQAGNSAVSSSSVQRGIRSILLRSPYTGWFPWDKTPGGWRLRVADFRIFEYLAARHIVANAKAYDIVQVCELPFLVDHLKAGMNARLPKVVMRLTAPDFYDPVGGLTKADAVIASGDTMRNVRNKRRPDCRDIPNGVDVHAFGFWDLNQEMREKASDSFREAHAISRNAIVITHVARFQAVKNHAMLVDAFALFQKEFPDAYLVLAGSGPLREQIQSKINAAGLSGHVIFLGEVRHADLPTVYAASDINVMASDYESFCFAVLEGMASSLPHVVTCTNWVPGLIGMRARDNGEPDSREPFTAGVHGDGVREAPGGYVTPVGDAGAFARALCLLAGQSDVRSRMGVWNRQAAVNTYGWQSSAAKLLSLYEELTGNEPRRN